MTTTAASLRAYLEVQETVALVEVAAARGSTPREKGAFMLVSRAATFGTIGGGQLEFMAIERARRMLERLGANRGRGLTNAAGTGFLDGETLDIPLGPEIGQCCGGWVELAIRLVDEAARDDLSARAEREDAARPHVYLFGGGHVGRALAAAFALLPVRTIVVETRAEALDVLPANVEALLTPMPEAIVRAAPAKSAFVVLTHDHALDFLLVAESLARTDAAYVGMIGSRTKKATFRSWYAKEGGTNARYARLVCPIGGQAVADKRPAVIAVLAAAEVITALVRTAPIGSLS